MSKIIVSEFVSYGHPDKIADQISDALLDEYLNVDPNTKAGIEVLVKDNVVVLGGEVKCNGVINHDLVVREVFDALNFSEEHNLNSDNIKILNLIGQQSPEINSGVEQSNGVIGAGDQGFMVGFASNETTPEYLPIGVYLSKTICQGIANSQFLSIGPDVKTQVTVDYTSGEPVVKHILVSAMHPGLSLDEVRDYVRKHILTNSLGVKKDVFQKYLSNNTELVIDINPCGSWYIGGPVADCGVTGRKIVVDQFGGYSNVGGGGFCFGGDTLVMTDKGKIKIKDLSVGDSVLTVNETTNKVEIKPITKTHKKTEDDSYELLLITLENGEEIKITENHEVLTKNGWVKAFELKVGEEIMEFKNFS